MPKFTKGEWKAGDTNCILGIPIFAEGSVFRVARVEDYTPKEEQIANARLIAAAPEMYNFIRTLYELLTNPEDDEEGLSFRFIPEAAKQILDRIDGEED